jgi:hypothetical protein
LRQVREEHPNLDDKTAVKMAEARRRLFYLRLSQQVLLPAVALAPEPTGRRPHVRGHGPRRGDRATSW